MGSMSRQNITTRKRGIYVKNQQQTEMAFQVNNQKFGISKYRFIQSDTQILQEEFEDTKGVMIIRISKKNRQHNDQ